MKKFRGFRRLCLDAFIKAGSRDMRCPWADFERTLEYEERASLDVIYPEDECVPMSDYLDEHGDPNTNGYGHTPYTLDGVSGMLVPLSKRARIR
eukprot:6430987-Prorocentrum_lima.AAC.1